MSSVGNLTSLSRATRAREWWRKHWYGVRGSWSSAWSAEIARDPLLRDARMVVDLVFGGGKRFRISTSPLAFDFSGSSGEVERIATLPLLKQEPSIETSYQMGSGAAGVRSVAFSTGVLPLDPWSEINRGRFLAGWGEISLIVPGMDYADRFVVMRGDMTGGVGFGTERGEMSFTLTDPKLGADLGITEFVVGEDRFADLADTFTGSRYPLVIGDPSKMPAVRVTATAPPTWLVCYGHDVTITQVLVEGTVYASGSAVYPWTAQQLFDLLGTPYTAIVFTAGSGVWEDSTSVHVSMTSAEPRNVIEAIRYLCEHWSILGPTGISLEAFSRASARCAVENGPQIYVNGSGDSDATRALDYVEGTICGSFPMISMAWQPSGYGPVITDRRAEPVATWWVGADLFRRSSDGWEETAKDQLYNWFTVRYGFNPVDDSYAGLQERNPNTSTICAISEEQAGPRDMGPLESVIFSSDALGTWIADWQVNHLALPSYLVEYEGPPSLFLKYRLGDNVDLIDEEIPGCDRTAPIRASIEAFSYVRGKCTILLRLWILYRGLAR